MSGRRKRTACLIRVPAVSALAVLPLIAACGGSPPPREPPPPVEPVTAQAPAPPVVVRDPELERRVARGELLLLERDAQIEELHALLEVAHDGAAHQRVSTGSLP